MSVLYSVIQYSPFKRPDERINVGVACYVVVTKQVLSKVTDDVSRVVQFDPAADLLVVRTYLDNIAERLSVEHFDTPEAFMQFCAELANQITMTPPRWATSRMTTTDQLADMYSAFVVEGAKPIGQ